MDSLRFNYFKMVSVILVTRVFHQLPSALCVGLAQTEGARKGRVSIRQLGVPVRFRKRTLWPLRFVTFALVQTCFSPDFLIISVSVSVSVSFQSSDCKCISVLLENIPSYWIEALLCPKCSFSKDALGNYRCFCLKFWCLFVRYRPLHLNWDLN